MKQRRRGVTAAAVAVLVLGTGTAAVAANLALLGADRDASTVGQLDGVAARAQLDPFDATQDVTATDAHGTTAQGISMQQAIAIATAEVGGTVIDVEWTTERGQSVYEVVMRLADGKEAEVYVSAADGTVLSVEREMSGDGERTESLSDLTNGETIGVEEAAAIARAAVGGSVIEVDRDREAGRDVYEVSLRQDDGRIVDVYVDARLGSVLRVDEDDWDDDDDVRDDAFDDEDARGWSGVTNAISVDDAQRIAIQAAGGGTVIEVGRSTHRGEPIWEVYVRDASRVTEVYVHAVSSAVLEVEIDD